MKGTRTGAKDEVSASEVMGGWGGSGTPGRGLPWRAGLAAVEGLRRVLAAEADGGAGAWEPGAGRGVVSKARSSSRRSRSARGWA